MKITYITESLIPVGGIERILTEKMNLLSKMPNIEVHLITHTQCKHPTSFTLSPNIHHHDLNIKTFHIYNYPIFYRFVFEWKMLTELKQALQKKIESINPDLIISVANYYPEVTCKLKTKAKIIIESHCPKNRIGKNENIKSSILKNWLIGLKYRARLFYVKKHSNCIVTLTNGDQLEWNTPKAKVIPNMTKAPTKTVNNYSNLRIVTMGRLVFSKGFDILINIWGAIHDKHKNWKLDIYGDGAARTVLQTQIEVLGLENSITLHHCINDVYSEFCKSSIFVFPSRYEGFGLTLCEAMSCGLPAVAFDCPYGPSDIIHDGEDGFLVKPNDLEGFADKLSYLMEHEDVRRRMGENAKKNIERYYPENIMPQWIQLFKELTQINS